MTPLRSPVPRSFLICLLAAVAVGSLALLAGDPAAAAPRKARARRASARVTAPAAKTPAPAPSVVLPFGGMMVAIEPETGALVRPTPEQVQQLLGQRTAQLMAAERTGLMRTSEGLTEARLKDGSVMVDLQGRFMEYEIVRLDAQGRPHFYPATEASAVRRMLDPATPAPTPNAEEK